jgi:hypothetical protein
VYGKCTESKPKPAEGTKLNRPAHITLFHCFPKNSDQKSVDKFEKYVFEKLICLLVQLALTYLLFIAGASEQSVPSATRSSSSTTITSAVNGRSAWRTSRSMASRTTKMKILTTIQVCLASGIAEFDFSVYSSAKKEEVFFNHLPFAFTALPAVV